MEELLVLTLWLFIVSFLQNKCNCNIAQPNLVKNTSFLYQCVIQTSHLHIVKVFPWSSNSTGRITFSILPNKNFSSMDVESFPGSRHNFYWILIIKAFSSVILLWRNFYFTHRVKKKDRNSNDNQSSCSCGTHFLKCSIPF